MQSVQNAAAGSAPKDVDKDDEILPIQSPTDETFKPEAGEEGGGGGGGGGGVAGGPAKRTKDQNSSRLPVVLWVQDKSHHGQSEYNKLP